MSKLLAGAIVACFMSMLSTGVLAETGGTAPEITAVPKKMVCSSLEIAVNGKAAKGQLCITEGMFAHDTYAFDIQGDKVLTGIDDETTKGLTGTYQGQSMSMVCTPELKAPKDDDSMVVSTEKSLMSKPGMTPERAHHLAVAMLTLEIGRQCVVKQGAQALMTVPVRFP